MTYTIEDGGRTLEATEEQAAIIDYALAHPEESIQIIALAGAAKTSTLKFLAKYLTVIPTVSIAFNKRIVEAMVKILPSHVKPSTANSIGHRVVAAMIGKRLTLDTKKNYNLVKEAIERLPKSQRNDGYDAMGDLMKAVSKAKLQGYVPKDIVAGKSLLTAEEFFGSLEEEPDDWFCNIVNSVLAQGIKQAYGGLIDFDDQIYISTLFGGSFPQFPRVMADEVQDFSPLNHAMLEKMVGPKTQLIAVGDPWQSIYAFRGADTKSMSWLAKRFNMHEMTLSVSFRCPIVAVEDIIRKGRITHMKYPAWAKQGHLEVLNEWDAKCIPDGSAIICRNNAPLVKCAYALLAAQRGVHLVGTDLGPQLVKALKKLGDDQMKQEAVYDAINIWETNKLRKSRDSGAVTDKAECLRQLASFGPTLGAAVAYCEHIFASKGPIQLLSGHKAKGLEWNTVYFLDPHRIPSPWSKEGEALEQEWNLEYVIRTRYKESMYIVRLDQFNGDME